MPNKWTLHCRALQCLENTIHLGWYRQTPEAFVIRRSVVSSNFLFLSAYRAYQALKSRDGVRYAFSLLANEYVVLLS